MERPSNTFVQLFLQYRKLIEELRMLKIANLIKCGYTKDVATITVAGIENNKYASYGLEICDETIKKQEEIVEFYDKHPSFIIAKKTWAKKARDYDITIDELVDLSIWFKKLMSLLYLYHNISTTNALWLLT